MMIFSFYELNKLITKTEEMKIDTLQVQNSSTYEWEKKKNSKPEISMDRMRSMKVTREWTNQDPTRSADHV